MACAADELPFLQLDKRTPELLVEVIALCGLVGTVVLVIASWSKVPNVIPHHFDFAGQPDRWGGRWVLPVMPAMSVAMYAFLTVMARFPHRFNYLWAITSENVERQYRIALSLLLVLKTEIVFLFGFITFKMVRSEGVGPAFLPVIVAILLGTILVYLAAAYRAR